MMNPLSYAMTRGFDASSCKDIKLEIGTLDQRRQMVQMADVVRSPSPSRRRDEIAVVLSGEKRTETLQGPQSGPCWRGNRSFVMNVGDATAGNLADLQARGTNVQVAAQGFYACSMGSAYEYQRLTSVCGLRTVPIRRAPRLPDTPVPSRCFWGGPAGGDRVPERARRGGGRN